MQLRPGPLASFHPTSTTIVTRVRIITTAHAIRYNSGNFWDATHIPRSSYFTRSVLNRYHKAHLQGSILKVTSSLYSDQQVGLRPKNCSKTPQLRHCAQPPHLFCRLTRGGQQRRQMAVWWRLGNCFARPFVGLLCPQAFPPTKEFIKRLSGKFSHLQLQQQQNNNTNNNNNNCSNSSNSSNIAHNGCQWWQ